MATGTSVRVETGIRSTPSGYECHVYIGNGRLKRKRFNKTTPLSVMRDWRAGLKSDLEYDRLVGRLPPEEYPRCYAPWCYVYFVRQGNMVKIGRARHLQSRVEALSTASPRKLSLVCVVPAHHSLETALHKRFAHLRQNGEWFELTDELFEFIQHLRTGYNPVAMLIAPHEPSASAWHDKKALNLVGMAGFEPTTP